MNTSTRRSASAGFTLMELMITVAIIGILAAVAVPQYTDYIRRGQLPEATSALSDYRIKMEQYFQDNRNYGSDGCAAGGSGSYPWAVFPKTIKYFSFDCTTTKTAYKITATGVSGNAVGYVYTVDQDGMATTKFKGQAVSGKACWLVRGDEC